MNKVNNSRALAAGVTLSLLVSGPAMADDIEIYVGANLASTIVPPNVLFVVDTSGSMGADVFTQPNYDPNTDYSGLPTSCVEFTNNRLFWSSGSLNTDCSTARWFDTQFMTCAAAGTSGVPGVTPGTGALGTTGFYQDRIARYSSNRWRTLTTSDTYKQRYVECASDSGVHGIDAASANVYAADNAGAEWPGTGGWSGAEANEINWNNEGNYTLYTANFMNYLRSDPTVLRSRLQVVQDVVTAVVGSVNGINIGLMRFSRDQEGGMVSYAMESIDTAETGFVNALNAFTPSGPTPLTEVLWEAMRYYRGDPVDYGLTSDPVPSVANSTDGAGNYVTPIEYECQRNSVILLTDGASNGDNGRDATLTGMADYFQATGLNSCPHPAEHVSADGDADDGQCLDQLANYMANADMLPAEFVNDQRVQTYTIGFQLDHPLLRATAQEGDGLYFTADDTAGLTNAFTSIINEVLASNSTFTSPAISVNSFSQTTHRNELYFTLFRPSGGPHWDGNLKKYRLDFDTDANGNSFPIVEDVTGQNAVDPSTGFFRDTARSWWSSGVDGSDVREGGAAEQLTATRNVYTYTSAMPPNEAPLTAAANQLVVGNAAVTEAMLGLTAGATNPSRDDIIQWAHGVDIDGDYGTPGGPRTQMGDPLHSQAAVIQYGGTEANPDLVIYFSTNDGYLHAVNESDGTENWAFIPQELLPNLPIMYENNQAEARPYGLDGALASWWNDENGDGTISGNDHVFLYGGMRRGGFNYYALDVTNRNQPVLKWILSNDPDGDGNPSGDFAEMGQTWSQPIVRDVMWNGNVRTVLIFGGGYDDGQDGLNLVAADDAVGRAIYVVDADTGALLWWAGPAGSGADLIITEMTNAIPAVVNGLDISGDGTTDRLYVGDMRAQIFRIDINEGNTGAANFATGGRIAALGGNTAASNRRFYHAADTAVIAPPGRTPYLALVIGSGFRAHPRDTTIEDRIYMIKDRNIFSAPENYVTLTEADLFDATDNTIGEGDATQRATALGELSTSDGWYIVLEDPPTGNFIGEKVLGRPLIVSGFAIVPSFIPADPNAGLSCGPNEGTGNLYFLNVVDATPIEDFDESGDETNLTRSDRVRRSLRGGIAPSPTLIIAQDEDGVTHDTGCSATDCFNLPGTGAPVKTYWFEN